MPHPIVYNGTQDDDRTRSIDFVHIEPSIREGVHLFTSLYGSDASAPLYRYPPTNTIAPWISGDLKIPNILTCNEGQWPASPSALFAYQWMSDGIDIPGETNRTYTTDASVDNTTITCELRGYNYLGEAYAFTAGVLVSLIEPIEVWEQEDYSITGVDARNAQTNRDERNMIITGSGSIDRVDTMRAVAYFMTGFAAEKRNDINVKAIPILTGLEREKAVDMTTGPMLAVVNWDIGSALVDGVTQPMNLNNNAAEAGMAGWEIFGAATYRWQDYYNGEFSWYGGDNVNAAQANIPYSYMWQDVEVFPIWEADVDGGTCSVNIQWYQGSETWDDYANIRVEFLNAAKAVLTSDAGAGLISTRNNWWTLRSFTAAVPAACRYVRVIPEFSLQSGNHNQGYVDQITLDIFKGTMLNSRSDGPDFKQWRINFTQANTWSGAALSELEFRDGVGGTDLATGGTIIKGSEGIGGLASYAFDDLRNTGYWAGESNGVSLGTAWIGYSKAATFRPVEIDITARSGSDSLQVGLDFTLEGTDDGSVWTKVQRYENIGSFTSEEQKQFVVADGAKVYTQEQMQIDAGATVRVYSTSNHPTKGTVFQAKTRMDVTHLRAYLEETGIDYKLQICRIIYGGTNGLLYQFHDAVSVSGTSVGAGYVEVALPSTFSLEVGDPFIIMITDENEPSNECRVAHFSTTAAENTFYAKRVYAWGTNLALAEGIDSEFTSGAFYDMDFRGDIF